MRSYVMRVVVEKAEDGGYLATSPDFAGCSAVGMTRSEAQDNFRSAAKALLHTSWQEAPPAVPRHMQRFAQPAENGLPVATIIRWPLKVLQSKAFHGASPTAEQILEK